MIQLPAADAEQIAAHELPPGRSDTVADYFMRTAPAPDPAPLHTVQAISADPDPVWIPGTNGALYEATNSRGHWSIVRRATGLELHLDGRALAKHPTSPKALMRTAHAMW